MHNFHLEETVTPIVISPRDLEQSLLTLGLVTANDWQKAVSRVHESGRSLNSTRIIEELCGLESQSKGLTSHVTVLTKYQADEILKGNVNTLRLGPYVLLNPLGDGGMGQVFRVLNTKQGLRRVEALKIVHNVESPWIRNRFRKEMQALALLSHPNIVQVYDVGESNGTDYFTMEIVEGRTLEKLVQEKGPLTLEDALVHIERVASALGHAHQHGVLHRDVKPQNIMISSHGDTKLLDLGVAQVRLTGDTEENMTQIGERFGTPAYMPPEQWLDARSTTAASDIYTLGGTFFYALTGSPPFPLGGAELLQAHVSSPRPKVSRLRPDLPKSLDPVIIKCLAPKLEDRYQTTAAMIEDLRQLRDADQRRPERRSPWPWIVGAIAATAILVAIVISALILIRPTEPSRIWLPSEFRAARDATLVQQGSQRLYNRIVPTTHPDTVFLLIPRTHPNDPYTFYITETEVTQGFVDSVNHLLPNEVSSRTQSGSTDERLPAVNLKVTEAHAVAQTIGALLPTVHQWDKAAGRFEEATVGESLLDRMTRTPDEFALRRKRTGGPAPVGTSLGDISPLGCRDMAGNVAEWTRDCESPNGYVPLKSPEDHTSVILRGRSYLDGPADLFDEENLKLCRYDSAQKIIGFRMVMEIAE